MQAREELVRVPFVQAHSVRTLRSMGAAVLVAITVFGAASCSSTVTEGRSPAYLIISSLEAASGAEPSKFSTILQSDVRTGGGVFEDPGRVVMVLALKDAGPAESPNAPSTNNFITVNRYHVAFRRSDGRNTQGLDVPYAFDGAATFTVGAGTATSAAFTIVRAQSKFEPPLTALAGGGGSIVISTIAEITFFGHDQTGSEVTVSGTISVNFADWADPATSS